MHFPLVARQFRLHLHRGIRCLATPGAVRSIAGLVKLAAERDSSISED